MAEMRQLSMDEALGVLSARAKSEGDSFRFRIFRKRSQASVPESICTLDGAELGHIAAPETWLPKLAGGGPIFTISVYHANDTVTALVQHIPFQIPGEALPEINFAALTSPGWVGPKKLVWPDPRDAKQQPQFPSYSIPNPQPSVASYSGATAPQTSVPAGSGPSTVFPSMEWTRLEAERNQLAALRMQLEEQRHKMELEGLRREQEAKLAAFEAKFLLAQQPTQKASGLADILAPLVPIAQAIIQSNNDMRVQMFNAQQESEKQRNQLMITLLEKKADDSPSTKILSTVADSMGVVMKMATDNMKTLQEAMNGPEEPTAMKVVREVVKGVNQIASGLGQQQKIKLPPKPAAPQLAPQLAGITNGHAGPKPAGATATQFQQSVHTPAAVPAQAPLASSVDILEAYIRRRAPVDEVVQFFITSFSDPAMVQALQGVDLNPINLFQQRLGDGWINEHPENGPYVAALAHLLQERLSAAGMLTEEPASRGEDGEEDAEVVVAADADEQIEVMDAEEQAES